MATKQCLYEVLGLVRDCTGEEIKSAYKKLALQRHPDKSGESATASFQELVNAYEILSDPRERAWYDSNRSQILFFSNPAIPSNSTIPNLFSFFSNSVFSGYADTSNGFYNVYADVFDKIYRNELYFAAKNLGGGVGGLAAKEAPIMGNLESAYTQVTAFYDYWLGFATVMDFCWEDKYDMVFHPTYVTYDTTKPKRRHQVGRIVKRENQLLRNKARREYNERVRRLAEFVKRRDKRVIYLELKKREMKMDKKMLEEMPETTRMLRVGQREDGEVLDDQDRTTSTTFEIHEKAGDEEEEEEDDDDEEIENNTGDQADVEHDQKIRDVVLYCKVCGKKFKSEKQWMNHEQSKKHGQRFREAFGNHSFCGQLEEA